MAEMRPFRGLRYDPARSGPLDRVIAPPYDVISAAQQAALYAASPYNVVRLEYGQEQGEQRYAAAAHKIAAWRRDGVLTEEPQPALYLYEQRFQRGGSAYRRRALLGRVRIEPFAAGIIRPHEFTLSGPKEDRLRLLGATHTQVSPVYCLYRADAGDPLASLELNEATTGAVSAVDLNGEAHTLAPVTDRATQQRVAAYLAPKTLYIADGHHRYETSLRYRDERRAAATTWTGDEPENFVMMAVTPYDDPGLLILPIHRIVRAPLPADVAARLRRYFDVKRLPGDGPLAVEAALRRLHAHAGAGSAFLAAGIEPGLLLLTPKDRAGIEALMPAERSAAWRALDVNVLQYGILEAALGISMDAIAAGGALDFTEDAQGALSAVDAGASAAFLVNPTRAEEIFAVADTGDRMPQKSTYFYPKLGTGLVLNALDL